MKKSAHLGEKIGLAEHLLLLKSHKGKKPPTPHKEVSVNAGSDVSSNSTMSSVTDRSPSRRMRRSTYKFVELQQNKRKKSAMKYERPLLEDANKCIKIMDTQPNEKRDLDNEQKKNIKSEVSNLICDYVVCLYRVSLGQ